jgi:hypothetical protein
MSELTCLELSVLLWLAHVLTQAFAGNAEYGLGWLRRARRARADRGI